jgi:hypothetical protein
MLRSNPAEVGFKRGEAHNGRIEVRLPNGTRCDCLTDIDLDNSKKDV